MKRLLTDVCRIQYGYPFDSAKFSENDGIPLVRIRDVVRGFSETKTIESFPEQYTVYDGDILIGMDGEFNIAKWSGGNAALNQRVCKLIPEKVNKDYIFYFMPVALKAIEAKTPYVTVKHLSAKELNKIVVPLPDIEKQKAIASTLLNVDRLISLRKQQLAKLDELIKARFVEMFGDLANPDCKWDKITLADSCANPEDIKCGPFGTQLGKDEYIDAGIAVWEIPQINSEFKTSPTHFISHSKAKELNAYSITAGDIAMSRKGNVGRCAVFPEKYDDGIIHSDVLRIRVDNKRIAPEFMMRQLHYSRDVQHQIELVSSGAIMAGINVTKLKQILVFVPPKDLQDTFVDFVEQINKSKAVMQKALDEAKILFDSLMQTYFG